MSTMGFHFVVVALLFPSRSVEPQPTERSGPSPGAIVNEPVKSLNNK